MLSTVILIRNIFYKCFLISFVYYVVVAVIFIFNKQWALNYTTNLYSIDKNQLNLLVLYFIGWMKMFTFSFFLIPALALHWTSAVLKKQENK